MTDTQLLPVIWTLASMVVAVLVTLLFSPARVQQLRLTLGGRIIEQAARLLYFIGVPYAALLTRAIAPIDMGLAGSGGPILGWTAAEWLHDLSLVLTMGLVVLIPIGIVGWQMARAGHPMGVDERPPGTIVVDAIYAEVHWAFYRAAPLIILGEVYGATLIGLALVGVELLVVLVRNGLSRQPEDRQSWLGQLLFLAMSAATFILTRNVWLAMVLHSTVEVLLRFWTLRLARRWTEPAPGEVESIVDPDVRPLRDQSNV